MNGAFFYSIFTDTPYFIIYFMIQNLRELTFRGIILGALITIVFTASNIYLGLKVGLTFSSAIPAAVISMAVLKLIYSKATILENNMIQTQASAAGTLSSIIFILPGLLMIGYWQQFHFWMTFLICAAGGMLGVLFTIPLRRAMIVESTLPFPEGVAAAEILKAGCDDSDLETDDTEVKELKSDKTSGAKDILFGGIVSAVVALFTDGFNLISGSVSAYFSVSRAVFQIPLGFSLALLSAGYLIGLTAGIAILIGMLTAWGVAVPIISSMHWESFQDLSLPSIANSIWASDIRYIGAGLLGIASIWTLLTLIKPVIKGVQHSFKAMKRSQLGNEILRTEKDLSGKMILLIMFAMIVILLIAFYHFIDNSGLEASLAWLLVIVSVLLAFVIGFLISAACGYMAGLVGSSSSPISGIGIVAVVVISLVLLFIGESTHLLSTSGGRTFVTALALFTTSVIIAVAAIANDNLQDLKTGYLVRATPWKQQIALLIGCVVGAIVIAPVLEVVYNAYGFAGAMPREGMDPAQALSAPQATLMTAIAQGIFSHKLDWDMINIGVILGLIVIIIDQILKRKSKKLRLPALAVGMGLYLPPSMTIPIVIGSLVGGYLKHLAHCKTKDANLQKNVDHKATLIASGFIVGESLLGVLLAILIVVSISLGYGASPLNLSGYMDAIFGEATQTVQNLLGLIVFIVICIVFVRRSLSAIRK